jgi:hypothetical protein
VDVVVYPLVSGKPTNMPLNWPWRVGGSSGQVCGGAAGLAYRHVSPGLPERLALYSAP